MFVFQTAYALSNLYQSVFGDKEKARQVIIDNDLDDHRSVFLSSKVTLDTFEKFLLFHTVSEYLLYRHECFTGKYATRKIHKNYIRDPSGLFCIISHVNLSMT